MHRLAHEKYWFTPNLGFNPLPTRFNFTEFLHAFRENTACQRKKEQAWYHYSTSIEYQRRTAFLAAVCGKTDSYLRTASQPIYYQGDQYGVLDFVYFVQHKILNCILMNTLVFGA